MKGVKKIYIGHFTFAEVIMKRQKSTLEDLVKEDPYTRVRNHKKCIVTCWPPNIAYTDNKDVRKPEKANRASVR